MLFTMIIKTIFRGAIESDVKKDLPGWETAANALYTVSDKVLSNTQVQALLVSFGVPAATISDVLTWYAKIGSAFALAKEIDSAAAATTVP